MRPQNPVAEQVRSGPDCRQITLQATGIRSGGIGQQANLNQINPLRHARQSFVHNCG